MRRPVGHVRSTVAGESSLAVRNLARSRDASAVTHGTARQLVGDAAAGAPGADGAPRSSGVAASETAGGAPVVVGAVVYCSWKLTTACEAWERVGGRGRGRPAGREEIGRGAESVTA
jgi:hypothetical protein